MLLNNRSHAKDGFRGKDSSILLMLAPPESFFVSKKTTAVRTDFFIKKSKASMSEQLHIKIWLHVVLFEWWIHLLNIH